jgi:cell division GTPase FtsZ
MKPSDRSLDIAVIGLGQGGGNLAAEFARRGYRAMALNTARSDLSALGASNHPSMSEAQRLYIGIDGYDGAGADLNYGRQCVIESAERIREVVARHTEGADVVMLTAGLGGGTGSAVAELVRVLEILELPITVLCTLPGDQESGIAKVNAVRAVSDLVKIPDLGLIFADNARLAELHGTLNLDEYFERINEIIVEPLDAFNQLNQREGLVPIRTLDGEDLRTLLMSTGVLNYSEGELAGLTVEGVSEWVSNALLNNRVMPAGFAMADIAYLGLVVEASGDLLSNTPFTFFNEVSEHLKLGTSGAGIYMGVYRNDQMPSHSTTLRLLASTPTLPVGIQGIVNAAQREGSALRDKLSRSVSSLDLGDIADFDLLPARSASMPPSASNNRRRSARPSRRTQSINARAQLDAPVTMPAAVHHAPEPVRPSARSPQAQPAARTVSAAPVAAAAPPAPPIVHAPAPISAPEDHVDPTADIGDRSEPETYDRLVDAFLNTASESIRRRIATRLHSSRNSDHPLARFYANRAIERLVDAGEEEALENVMSQLGAE